MRVCVAKKSNGYQWQRAGEKIRYCPTKSVNRPYVMPNSARYFHALSFTYTLGKQDRDTIYFSFCYPYTFSRLTQFLKELHIDCQPRDCMKEAMLCKSLSGLTVPILTVTSRVKSDPTAYNMIRMDEFEDPSSRVSVPLYKKKKYAVISGRVHPGETPASWMMQGFLKCLTGDSHAAV